MFIFVTIIINQFINFFFLVVSLRLELNMKESLKCSKDDVRGLLAVTIQCSELTISILSDEISVITCIIKLCDIY